MVINIIIIIVKAIIVIIVPWYFLKIVQHDVLEKKQFAHYKPFNEPVKVSFLDLRKFECAQDNI